MKSSPVVSSRTQVSCQNAPNTCHSHLWCVTGYLSPRTIYFGEGQIHFGEEYIKDHGVKKSKIKSQCGERKQLLNISSPHYLTEKNNARSRGDWHGMWWSQVNEYLQRDLAHGKDKPIAIAGLASYLQDWLRSHDESLIYNYIAGLWEPELPAGLLWYVDMGRQERRSKPYRAPSWSQASVDGAVFSDSMDLSNATCGVNISGVSIRAPGKAAGDDTITPATRPDTIHSMMSPREAPSQFADSSKGFLVPREGSYTAKILLCTKHIPPSPPRVQFLRLQPPRFLSREFRQPCRTTRTHLTEPNARENQPVFARHARMGAPEAFLLKNCRGAGERGR